MNSELKEFAKQYLIENLGKLTEGNIKIFKRMYSHQNLDASIEEVVNNMPEDKLDWAMQQVKNT